MANALGPFVKIRLKFKFNLFHTIFGVYRVYKKNPLEIALKFAKQLLVSSF
jgi:hypothetical protein